MRSFTGRKRVESLNIRALPTLVALIHGADAPILPSNALGINPAHGHQA